MPFSRTLWLGLGAVTWALTAIAVQGCGSESDSVAPATSSPADESEPEPQPEPKPDPQSESEQIPEPEESPNSKPEPNPELEPAPEAADERPAPEEPDETVKAEPPAEDVESSIVRLTDDPADDWGPIWSPDGTQILFTSNRGDDSEMGDREIFVMRADGTDVRQLTDDDDINWVTAEGFSPDGTQVLFTGDHDGNREIFVVQADGTNVRQLTSDSAYEIKPVWSPDGSRILFVSHRDGGYGLYSMRTDGTDVRQFTVSGTDNFDPVWSPDRTRILFTSDRDGDDELFVMNSDGSNERQLTDNDTDEIGPAWSPDGTRVVFTTVSEARYQASVIRLDSDESPPAVELLTGPNIQAWDLAWSPDGKHILFIGDSREGRTDLHVMEADGSRVRRLTEDLANEQGAIWSPDGTQILFVSYHDHQDDIFLVKSMEEPKTYIIQLQPEGLSETPRRRIFEPNNTRPTVASINPCSSTTGSHRKDTAWDLVTVPITNNNYNDTTGDWSPDGTQIVFSSFREGDREIYVINADGSSERPLTHNEASDIDPNWSPDGEEILFSSNRDGNREIYVMNADGSQPRRLTHNESVDVEPDWSPDGTQILFSSNRDGNREIYVMNADGSQLRRLTHNNVTDEDPEWSPDGTQMLFTSERDGPSPLYIFTMDTQTVIPIDPIVENYGYALWPEEPSWSSDGTQILFTARSEIHLMNIDGTDLRQLTYNDVYDGQPVWSPDGTRFLFTRNDGRKSEIYIKAMGPMADYPVNIVRLFSSIDFSLRWSPDGTRILFTSTEDGDSEIYVMNTDGRNIQQLTHNTERDYGGSWSPDGTKIIFNSEPVGSNLSEIYVMDTDGRNIQQLTHNTVPDYGGSWSPDGTKIIFTGARDVSDSSLMSPDGREIFVMNADGTDISQLTFNDVGDFGGSWSSDGTQIFFTRGRYPGEWSEYVMNVDGTGKHKITDLGYGIRSGDDQILYSSSYTGPGYHIGQIFIMNADGTDERQLTHDETRKEILDWSPDHSLILFTAQPLDTDSTFPYDYLPAVTYVMHADGTNRCPLFPQYIDYIDIAYATWSPNGERIYFVGYEDDALYMMDTATVTTNN